MTILLTQEDIEQAKKVARIRNEKAILAHADPQKYGFKGENLSLHVEGALAEKAASKALELEWDIGPWQKRSWDIGNLQIRSTKYTTGKLIVRPADDENDTFVLVISRSPKFEIKGWIKGKDAKKEEWIYSSNGRPPAWFVPQSQLNSIDTLIKTQIKEN